MRPSLRFFAFAAFAAALLLAPALGTAGAAASDAVTVPDVGGMVWQDAVAALQGVGLVAQSGGDGVVVPQVSTIADQCPRAGDTVPPGSTVTLTTRTSIADCATVGYGGSGSGGGAGGGGTMGAVAMWPLDESSGTTAADATGTGHDGTYEGAVTLGGAGAPQNGNAAAGFSGGDVTVPYGADLNPAAYTVEAWVNPAAVNTYADEGEAARPIVCSRDDTGIHGYLLYADNYTGVPQFAFAVGAGTSRRYVYDNSGTPEQTGQWYHVAAVFDGTDLHLYVNGVDVTSAQLNDGNGTTIAPNPSFPLMIGNCTGGSAPWQGAIQDVSLWDTALPAATIAQQASSGTPPPGGGSGGGCDPSDPRCTEGAGPSVPLVFLPGITGSTLSTCGGTGVWPDAILDNALLADLAYGATCLEYTGVLKSFLGRHFYDKTVDALTRLGGYELGKTLFPCPFDWRTSASVAWQTVLADCIANALSVSHASQVDVLAHSQGGLVASELVLHTQGLVRRLVTMGTPVLGAEKALDIVEWAHECIVGSIIFGICVPIDKSEAQAALGTMPGYFELLPSPAYAAAVAPPLIVPGKSSTAYSTLENYVNERYPGMLGQAVPLHTDLDDFTPTVPMLRIVGYNTSTLVQVKLQAPYQWCLGLCITLTHTDYVYSKLGDGTVPLNSADLQNSTGFDHRNGVPNRYFEHDHMGLAQSDDSIKAAVAFFRAATVAAPKIAAKTASVSPVDSVALPPDTPGTDIPGPTTPSVEVEVFGEATSAIQSLSGDLLGDGADGIDGGTYGHSDGTDTFTLDTPGSYTAVVQANDPTPLEVLVRRYADVVQQQSLFSVPAPAAGDVMTLSFTTDQDLGTLRLDDNGTELAPVSTTNGDDAVEDATPPTTVAGGAVTPWGKATVTIAAHDDSGGTGVAATYVETAGAAAPTLYTKPFQVPLFSSVSYWSVDAAGNEEAVHTTVVDDTPDVRDLATPIATGQTVLRTIWPAGDEDWFRFTADGSSLVTAQVDGLLAHFDLELYDATGRLLQAPQSHLLPSEEVRGVLPAGTYYLRVFGTAHRLLPYTLTLHTQRR